MSVYNEANVSCEPRITGGPSPFNYLDGAPDPQDAAKSGFQEGEKQSVGNTGTGVAKSAGDGPPHCGEGIASAPAMTEMYRGTERGLQLPRDSRINDRALQHVQNPLSTEAQAGSKRTVQSQPELGCRSGNERRFSSVGEAGFAASGADDVAVDGRDADVASASDINGSVSFEHNQKGQTESEVGPGQSEAGEGQTEIGAAHSTSRRQRSNATLVTSNPSVHKLSRRSEKRLKKSQGRENAEELEMASVLSHIYRRSAHTGANYTMMALKSSQSSSQVIQWLQNHGDFLERGSEYRKTEAPKKRRRIEVDTNVNNNAGAPRRSEERISSNRAMEALRRQPLKLAEKEEIRSIILKLASESKSPLVGSFDRRRHIGFRRHQLKDRRRREPRGSGGFFVNLIKEFGQSITSYFDFLRWLILVNVVLSLIVVTFLVIPQYFRQDIRVGSVRTNVSLDKRFIGNSINTSKDDFVKTSVSGILDDDVKGLVAAFFSGSKFMTQFPSPIFFNFYGERKSVEASEGGRGGGGGGAGASKLSEEKITQVGQNFDGGTDSPAEEKVQLGSGIDAEVELSNDDLESNQNNTLVNNDNNNNHQFINHIPDGGRRKRMTSKRPPREFSRSHIRFASWLEIPYDFPLAFVLALNICLYFFIVFVLVKMAPFAMESISAKLERVDRGFTSMIFATFDHGTTDETTLIMNQITMTDELLMKLDAADTASSAAPRPRIRARRCCDVVLRLVVAAMLLAFILLLAWTIFLLIKDPTYCGGLMRMQVNSNLEVLTFSATTRCAAAFFDDFAAPIILFFGIKGLKGFSTMIASVENWKPAKKDKVNQGRVLAAAISLTFFYFHCLWRFSEAWTKLPRGSEFTAGCSEKSTCWPVLIGQHLYRLWMLDLLWSIFVVVAIQFPRKLLFSQLCLHRSCGHFSIQPFSISRRILDLIYAQMLCLVGLYFAPGIVFLTTLKFVFVFYLMRLTVHCNCIPKGRLFQSIDSVVFSYTLLGISAVLAVLPFQLSLMRGLPISECGPFVGIHSFSQVFHVSGLTFVPAEILESMKTFLDSPLAPYLVFLVVIILVVGVVILVIFIVQRQKIYQLQHENDAERRDRAFLLRQYETGATAVPSDASLKNNNNNNNNNQ